MQRELLNREINCPVSPYHTLFSSLKNSWCTDCMLLPLLSYLLSFLKFLWFRVAAHIFPLKQNPINWYISASPCIYVYIISRESYTFDIETWMYHRCYIDGYPADLFSLVNRINRSSEQSISRCFWLNGRFIVLPYNSLSGFLVL